MIDYVKMAIIGGVLFAAFGSGWYVRNLDYKAFKLEVEHTAQAQEANIKSIQKQQALVTKSVEKEYEAKLAAVRNYYKSTSVWNNPSSSKVSGLSTAPSATDVITAYNVLAGQCAETTQQIVSLQAWLNEQMGIK
jgi:hypothetical protein